MQAHPLRLSPGDDLRGAIEAALHQHEAHAAFVIQGIGSLSVAQLRFAGVDQPTALRGDLEILTLAGSVSPDGAHLHMSVSDADGRVTAAMSRVVAWCARRPRSCSRCCPRIASRASPMRAPASTNW